MSSDARRAREEAFVAELKKLSPGDKARLKRHAGMTLDESPDVFGPFFRILPHEIQYPKSQEAYFLVATLFPLADESKQRGGFGMTLRRMRTSGNEAGLNRRVEALLDADEQQLPFRLRQLVRLAHSNRVGIDWAELLRDILAWGHPDRWVQKKWAMDYFSRAGRDDRAPDTAGDADAEAAL
jgi:CRISPR system Cascade subunit CasB